MKVLSIKPPWAYAIIYGGKDIENRTWNTKFRGRFFIHCSLKPDNHAPKELWNYVPTDRPAFGGIIGSVELIDVVEKSDSKWFQGPKGFILKDPKEHKFVPLKGKLGFFEMEIE